MDVEQYHSYGTEGYVKFSLDWRKAPTDIPTRLYNELEKWRAVLYSRGAVGAYPDGIGFGNISHRVGPTRFYITGSATGKHATLSEDHYALVTSYSLPGNSLTCTGMTKASSESLSHAAIYEAAPETRAVAHIHHHDLWVRRKNRLPTTASDIEYGTPEMAAALKECASSVIVRSQRVIVMGGHEDGVIAFGESLEAAVGRIIMLLDQIRD